jgi:hypothetical protein
MNNRLLGSFFTFIIVVALVITAAVYFGKQYSQKKGGITAGTHGSKKNNTAFSSGASAGQGGGEGAEASSEIQDELDKLSNEVVANLKAESRININMFGNIRSYEQMLKGIQVYAQDVEKQIQIVEEIAKDEFQEDVKLQANLFNGKKPAIVSKHLEEFKASRVGAILAKMKEKEASAVFDMWAKEDDPRIGAFYREAMASYLHNKRRDMHPELFQDPKGKSKKTASQ